MYRFDRRHYHLPYPWNKPLVQRHQRFAMEDLLVTPRCPACRFPLIARVLPTGPGFRCNCKKSG